MPSRYPLLFQLEEAKEVKWPTGEENTWYFRLWVPVRRDRVCLGLTVGQGGEEESLAEDSDRVGVIAKIGSRSSWSTHFGW